MWSKVLLKVQPIYKGAIVSNEHQVYGVSLNLSLG